MRARLRKLPPGGQVQFICDPNMAEKMARVISFADGKLIRTTTTEDGVIIVAEKT